MSMMQQLTNMGFSAAQHDSLHEAAQGQAAIWVLPFQRSVQKASPHIAVIEGLMCQKLQQPLYRTGTWLESSSNSTVMHMLISS